MEDKHYTRVQKDLPIISVEAAIGRPQRRLNGANVFAPWYNSAGNHITAVPPHGR
jgi:hypothetical protein